MPTNFPANYDDSGSLPTKADGDTIFAAEDNTQIGALVALEKKIGKSGTEPYINAKLDPYNIKGDGTDEATALQTLFNAAAAIGAEVYFPAGTYLTNTQLEVAGSSPATAKGVKVRGAGVGQTTFIAGSGIGSNAVFNVHPTAGSQTPDWEFSDIFIDQRDAASSSGIVFNNTQLVTVERMKFRGGSKGIDIVTCGGPSYFRSIYLWNQTTAGAYYRTGSGTNTQGHSWSDCMFFYSGSAGTNRAGSGAAVDGNAGWWLLGGGQDFSFTNCRVERQIGIAQKLPYGFNFDGPAGAAPYAAGQPFLTNCVVDGITDRTIGTNSAATSAAYRFSYYENPRMTQCWASSIDTGVPSRGPAVLLSNVQRMVVENCHLSGQGVKFENAVDMVQFNNNTWPNVDSTEPCFWNSGATVTNLVLGQNTKQQSTKAWANDLSAFATSINAANTVTRRPMFTKAGVPTDADFTSAFDGDQCLDTTNHYVYIRDGAKWRKVDNEVFNVKTFGAVGTGANDTTAIANAITAAGQTGIVYFPPGFYATDPITIAPTAGGGNQLPTLIGSGPEKTTISLRSGATSPLLTVAPSTFSHHLNIQNLYFTANSTYDVNGAGTGNNVPVMFLTNQDFASFENVKIRHGTYGLRLGDGTTSFAAAYFHKVVIFNPSSAGVWMNQGTTTQGGNTFTDCIIYQTTGATTNVSEAAFRWTKGADTTLSNFHILRAPGIAWTMRYGLKVDAATYGDVGFLFVNGFQADGMSSRTASDETNCTPIQLTNLNFATITESWTSANSAAAGDTQGRSMIVDGSKFVNVSHCWLSGNGVEFKNTPIRPSFTGNHFSNGNSFMFIFTSTPTDMVESNNVVEGGAKPLANSLSAYSTATNKNNRITVLVKSGSDPVDSDFAYAPPQGTLAWRIDQSKLFVSNGAGGWTAATGSSVTLPSEFSVDVRDAPYSADPTGSANASDAINSAITAANTAGGGVVDVVGTFKLDKSLLMKANVWLRGAGIGRTILKGAPAATGSTFLVDLNGGGGGVSTETHCRVTDLTIDMNARAGGWGANQGGGLRAADFMAIERVHFYDKAYFGLWLNECKHVAVRNPKFSGTSSQATNDNIGGGVSNGGTNYGNFDDVLVEGGYWDATIKGNALDLVAAKGLTFRKNYVAASKMFFEGCTDSTIEDNTFYATLNIKTDVGYGTQCHNARNMKVRGNRFPDNYRIVTDGAMTSASATLTCATSQPFVQGDIGKRITVVGAGASGADLVTTISGYTSASVVTLAATASTTVSANTVRFGNEGKIILTYSTHASLPVTPGGGNVISENYIVNPIRYGILKMESRQSGQAETQTEPDTISDNTVLNTNLDSSSTTSTGTGTIDNAGIVINGGGGDVYSGNHVADNQGTHTTPFAISIGATSLGSNNPVNDGLQVYGTTATSLTNAQPASLIQVRNSAMVSNDSVLVRYFNTAESAYDYTISFDGTNYTAEPNTLSEPTFFGTDLTTVFNSLTSYIGPATAGPLKGPAGGTTTLTAAITVTTDDITINVADGTFGGTNPLSTSDKFLIQIDNEYMNADSITGNQIHITKAGQSGQSSRGTMGSTAATHLINAVVTWYDLTRWGGSIYLVQPPKSAGPMIANNALKGINGLSLIADGGEVIIKASNSFPTNTPVIDFAYTDRITIRGLVVDCNNKAQVGIRHRRNQNFESASNLGGPASGNFIENCRVYNYTGTTAGFGAAYMVGIKDESTATANLSFSRNTARGAGFASVTSTLNTTIDNATTSISVTNSSTFPATDASVSAWASDFIIKIDNEYMLCHAHTSGSPGTLTVRRGALGTTPMPHTSTATVTAYFGSCAVRVLIGDFQMTYCNFNNTAGNYSSGIYGDAHFIVMETHVAASSVTSPACVYIRGSNDHCVVSECYLDTVQAGAGIYVNAATGASNHHIFRNNYYNKQSNGIDPTREYCIIVDSSLQKCINLLINGNESKGSTANGTKNITGVSYLSGTTYQLTIASQTFSAGATIALKNLSPASANQAGTVGTNITAVDATHINFTYTVDPDPSTHTITTSSTPQSRIFYSPTGSALNFDAFLNIIGTQATGMLVSNNSVRGTDRLFRGTTPAAIGVNIIDDNVATTPWKVGGGEALVKAGVPSAVEGIDFLHLYAGLEALNTSTSNWYVYNGSSWTNAGGGSTSVEQLLASFSKQGTLSASTGSLRAYISGTHTITKVRASVGTVPNGAIQMDINKANLNANLPGDNTTSIWTTNQVNRVSIGSGNHTGVQTSFDVTALADGDFLTLDIDSVPSTPGADLVVEVWGT